MTDDNLILFLALVAALATLYFLFAYRSASPIDYSRCRRERDFQRAWQQHHGGEIEVEKDGWRCDWIGTVDGRRVAAEFDFATRKGIKESLLQALVYGWLHGLPPAVVLIIRNDAERRNYELLLRVIKAYRIPVTVWTIKK